MKKRKAIPLLAAVSIMLLSHSSVIATAVDDNHQVNLSNDYLSCIVEQDSESLEYLRFGLRTNIGNVKNENDDDRFLLYNNFFTGYTSVNVGGNTYVYGTGKIRQNLSLMMIIHIYPHKALRKLKSGKS